MAYFRKVEIKIVCNAEEVSDSCGLLELMGAEKLETWVKIELSVEECEIVYKRN